MYIVGFLLDKALGDGAVVNSERFNFYLPVGTFTTHINGELEPSWCFDETIAQYLESFKNAFILSHSASALQAPFRNK